MLASSKDLQDAFGKDDVEELLRHILDKGEYHVRACVSASVYVHRPCLALCDMGVGQTLVRPYTSIHPPTVPTPSPPPTQPSDKEREAMLESAYRDIATIVTEKTVNPASNRPYTLNMVLNGMKALHFAVNPTRSAKQQALEVIKKLKVRELRVCVHTCWSGRGHDLRPTPYSNVDVMHHTNAVLPRRQEVMPIERAKMHLRAFCGPEVRCQLWKTCVHGQHCPSIHTVPQPENIHATREQQDLDTVVQGLKKLGIEPTVAGGEPVGAGAQHQEGEAARRRQFNMLVDPGLFRQVGAGGLGCVLVLE